VGGGIREPEKAREVVEAGANIIVTGTIIEKDVERAKKIIEAIKRK
ncbi:MAG: geranylgeranylglyceryl/heptaprenylglyceryl phosphate synthase, partial [Candidatus Nezhaarchaeales archaeon]